MIINREKEYIFIHIPRTSGTNLYNCLSGKKYDESGNGHIFARNIKKKYSDEFKNYFKFTIVRNDYERIYSWWWNRRFLKNSVNVDFKAWLLRDPKGFPDFGRNWEFGNKWGICAQQTSQLEWLTDKRGKIIVDHIVRFEYLKRDLKTLGTLINEDFSSMPRYGKNNPENLGSKYNSSVYDQEMIDFIQKHHIRSIKRFGYEL